MREILVHLDGSADCAVRLRIARRLAQRHAARVNALFAVSPASAELPSSFSAHVLAEAARAGDIDGRLHARAAVEKAVALGGPPVQWSESTAEPPLAAVLHRALFADLLVLGKRDPQGRRTDQLPADFAETVALHSGKPCLVVPDALPEDMSTGDAAQRVVVAWKPAREAARAITAAMPLLKTAQQVHVVTWAESREALRQAPLEIDAWLRAHGVAAQLQVLGPTAGPIGEAILAQAATHRADLLVMGCYGHSRARELVLGGASRSVLRELRLPVLVAH